MIKTSIIVLTYNSAAHIEKLVKSIYKYNINGNFETVIVDNASQDDTVGKSLQLKSYDLKLIQNKENVGFSKGINIGAKEASGKYLGILGTLILTLGLDEALGFRFSPGQLQEVDFVSGGFMMVRSDVFRNLGGFDENYFMYVEDIDLC